jgi:RNA polymerase sigma-70 factor (ECF subfamily)
MKKMSQGDPASCLLRILFMLIGIGHVQESDAFGAHGPYSGACMPLKHRSGRVRVTAAKTQEMDWVACMERVCANRDQAAFVTIFRHFAPRVKAFLMRSGASESLAEECTQEVMATVWRKAQLFDPARASVATWIFTIARNRKIDALRKQRRPEPEDLTWGPEAEPDQADVMALQQESDKLGRALAALPDKQRELIERAYFNDLSHSEIAEQTGLPLGTIKSRIRLALERLRHEMK